MIMCDYLMGPRKSSIAFSKVCVCRGGIECPALQTREKFPVHSTLSVLKKVREGIQKCTGNFPL